MNDFDLIKHRWQRHLDGGAKEVILPTGEIRALLEEIQAWDNQKIEIATCVKNIIARLTHNWKETGFDIDRLDDMVGDWPYKEISNG